MIDLIIFIFASIGMSHIIVDGSIFASFKAWLEKESYCKCLTWMKKKIFSLITCYQCSGFWTGLFSGLFLWLLGHDPLHIANTWYVLLALFLYGCSGAYLSVKAYSMIIWLQSGN